MAHDTPWWSVGAHVRATFLLGAANCVIGVLALVISAPGHPGWYIVGGGWTLVGVTQLLLAEATRRHADQDLKPAP